MQKSASHRRLVYSSGSSLREGEPGQVIILFALMSIVLLGMLALAVDVGYLLSERREVQAAADSAALAAAVAAYNVDTANIESSADSYAIENAGVTSSEVDFQSPPTSGAYAGQSDYFQVTVRKDVQRFFLGAVYTGDWSVEATAVAGVEIEGVSTGLLATNSEEGGIQTSGDSTITVSGASVVSNYNITTSGSTVIDADQAIMANDGIFKSGDTDFFTANENPSAPEMPDPLADKIDPPNLPTYPGNPVPNASNSTPQEGGTFPDWPWPDPGPEAYVAPAGGVWTDSMKIQGKEGGPFVFPQGDYRFENAKIDTNYESVRLEGGTWNFKGSNGGILIGGDTPRFEMLMGEYSFTNGARITIQGSAPNNILGTGGTTVSDSIFYFGGGGGLQTGGDNDVTLYPGTYIFDGGPGLTMSGSSVLTFMPGDYEFWFNKGADFKFSGNSRIYNNGDIWVDMYFYGEDNNPSNLDMSGSTSFNIPSGAYYFDNGQLRNSGDSEIRGEEVFLYFTNGSYMHSSGSARFSFTAPNEMIYPGYFPGVYIYSDRDNTAPFQWNGSSSSQSVGIVYIPSSPLIRTGYSYGMQWRGQLIVDRLILSGGNETGVEYEEFVQTEFPAVYLVE